MSSRNAKQRETLRGRVPREIAEDGPQDAIEWRPDWARSCEICGQTPCMVGMSCDVVVVEAMRAVRLHLVPGFKVRGYALTRTNPGHFTPWTALDSTGLDFSPS